ncbi:metalloregulator ArsR/SmtB family transcription factor [Microbacterium sp. HD4P20]|uniref:ArsR/SmtB family transcription factor n=1 Tax=Microbacterium sp. HD4P20 TaxID=2864874 RepID=UPI001C640A05|nr:metalloregulator ArsR/SmtB family transcription factor [Microbacterium sp. HD4P20]MCP2635257.1 metalloregulator ArsR/SmtB family transcription factor [Microbacterium sp. HD4P20]
MNRSTAALNDAFRALSDPNRRAILGVIRGGRRAVGELADELGISQQNVSHHLKILDRAGLVDGVRQGTRHMYALRVEGLAVGKAFFDDFWPERLSELKRAAERRHEDG